MAGTILLVTWDGAGNVPPEFAVCRALVEAGHEVHILTHDSLEKRAKEIGAIFRPIHHAGQLDPCDPDESMQDRIDHAILSDPLVSDIDEAIEALVPDVVIADSMLLLGLAKLAQGPVPSVAFHHSLGEFLFGGLLDEFSMMVKDEIDGLLEARGLTPYERPVMAITENDLVLTATYRDFDQPGVQAPDNLFYIGPLRSRPRQGRGEIDRHLPERPFVVVSLSTSHMEQLPLLQRIGDALGRIEVEGLITTGPAIDPGDLSLPENARAVEFVAHEDVLTQTDLLLTHAGHGTVMAGSTFGTPMLCFPMGRDQPAVAERARELGLAHVCLPDASTEEIAAAVTDALADSGMAATSKAFSEKVESHPGIEDAVMHIEGLME